MSKFQIQIRYMENQNKKMFEKKIVSVLFPLVAQTLLAELNELELDFKNYLNRSIKSSNGEYEKMLTHILKIF